MPLPAPPAVETQGSLLQASFQAELVSPTLGTMTVRMSDTGQSLDLSLGATAAAVGSLRQASEDLQAILRRAERGEGSFTATDGSRPQATAQVAASRTQASTPGR